MTLRMLVPLDGFALNEQALGAALEVAAAAPVELFLLQVIPPAASVARANPDFDPRSWDDSGRRTLATTVTPVVEIETVTQATERAKAEAEDYLASIAARFPSSTVHVHVRVAEHPAEEIVHYAEECQPNFIVMPGHGRRPLARAFLSSTTEHVVRAGRFPVVLVPPKD